jgi:hypothetical protein
MLTDAGTKKEQRESHNENALTPMTFRLHIAANVTSERNRQSRKHSSPRNSIDAGTEKEEMRWFANARFWIIAMAGIAGIEERESIRRYIDLSAIQASHY